MTKPQIINDDAFRCLRCGEHEKFNRIVGDCEGLDFSNADLRAADLRHANLADVNLAGAYFRDADLRGADFRQHDLEGCSLLHAKVSGTFFPANLSPQEIMLSLEYGTRLRTAK